MQSSQSKNVRVRSEQRWASWRAGPNADVVGAEVLVAGQVPLDAWNAMTTWCNNQVPPATILGVSNLGFGAQQVGVDALVVRSS